MKEAKKSLEGTKLKGHIELIVKDKNGKIKDTRSIDNLIVNTGKAGVASRINGADSEAAFTYLAVGIGTNAPTIGDTALGIEITDSGLARAAAVCTRTQTTTTNDTAKLSKTWNVTGTKSITECGILNASSAGTLLGRQVFPAVDVVNGDLLQIDYSIVCS